MKEPIPYLAEETAALRRLYAALNRNDIPAMMEEFAPDAEWLEPADLPGGGVYRGRPAVAANAARARATWAEGSCDPEQFITVPGDRIVVFDSVHVRLKTETEWRDGAIAAVYTFRDGLVVQGRVFLDRDQALAWARTAAPVAE
ncbi:MAG TPA: nuclear transport factor 2 family protein [Bryobacteraceae bacterium]|nr:nuclear transport factor 2 family protein [Bryobacteraceae bacterium]